MFKEARGQRLLQTPAELVKNSETEQESPRCRLKHLWRLLHPPVLLFSRTATQHIRQHFRPSMTGSPRTSVRTRQTSRLPPIPMMAVQQERRNAISKSARRSPT